MFGSIFWIRFIRNFYLISAAPCQCIINNQAGLPNESISCEINIIFRRAKLKLDSVYTERKQILCRSWVKILAWPVNGKFKQSSKVGNQCVKLIDAVKNESKTVSFSPCYSILKYTWHSNLLQLSQTSIYSHTHNYKVCKRNLGTPQFYKRIKQSSIFVNVLSYPELSHVRATCLIKKRTN